MTSSVAPIEPQSLTKSQTAWTRMHALAIAVLTATALVWQVAEASAGSWRMIAVLPIGLAIGATLLLANFGFASAFRQAATAGDFATFRAHALMLGLATMMMTPILAAGSLFGQPMSDFATPIGISLALGGVLFGIGMQLSGGCASGTLFLLGGGNLKFLAVLAAFVVGSTVGAAHAGFWHSLPAFAPITVRSIGPWPLVLAAELAVLALLWWKLPSRQPLPRRLLVGAVALALLNVATLVVAGRPWSETYGFALWGSKLSVWFGFDPASWAFWEGGTALDHSIFGDITSIMDMSIILGALAAAAAACRFDLKLGGGWRSWILAAIGGLLMGYAARMADGCNIGAYFSAIASGSFSGYVWAGGALAGSLGGARFRLWIERDGNG